MLFSVAECKEVKMPPTNIAKIFGPTLVGYSSNDPDQHAIFTETLIQASVSIFIYSYKFSINSKSIFTFYFQVMEMLLKIPADYWEQFVNIKSNDNQNDRNDHREEFGNYLAE